MIKRNIKKVYFMHIPRTGGGSLRYELKGLFREGLVHEGDSWRKIDTAETVDYNQYECLTTFWPVSSMVYIPDSFYKITLVRNPIMRVISHYNYLHISGDARRPQLTSWIKAATFKMWLRHDYGKYAANNLMTRFFCDRVEANLNMAFENIKMLDYIGIFESNGIQKALTKAREVLQLPPKKLSQHRNRSGLKVVIWDELDTSIQNEVIERNSKDIQLYKMIIESDD